jgi:hypothetical protein
MKQERKPRYATLKSKVQVKVCLGCSKNKVKLRWNEHLGRFEGNRICSTCRKAQKMKFFGGMNGG